LHALFRFGHRIADDEFIDELNTFTLPMMGSGNYRAFEIIGDSMLPTPSGSIIVGQKMDSIDDVKQNAACIVVSRNEGIVYKRVSRSVKTKNKVTLTSDNPSFQPYQINAEDILEIWQAQMVNFKSCSAATMGCWSACTIGKQLTGTGEHH